MHYSDECLSEKLIEARKYRGYSQQYLAKIFGFEPGSYSKWERGKAVPSAKQIALLADVEGIDINFYFVPDMNISEADLNNREKKDVLERLADRLEDIEEKIMPAAEYDPLAHHVKTHKELREVVEMLTKLDERSLIEARGLIRGFMVGSGRQEREEPESMPDEREKGNLNAG